MKYTKGPWEIRKEGTTTGRSFEVYTNGARYDDGSEFVIADAHLISAVSVPREGTPRNSPN